MASRRYVGAVCATPTRPTDAELRDRVRDAGLRATRGRIAVYALLCDADAPVSHADVVDTLGEHYDRASLYRNLTDLTRVGLLRRFDVGDHIWRFERIDDGEGEAGGDDDHPHFVCVECGQVECLPGVALEIRNTRRAPAAVSSHSVEVQLRGLCDGCA